MAFFTLCLVLLWLVQPRHSCASFQFSWLGLMPMQVLPLPCPALPCPAPPCPAPPCPALPCPALPCPALPCPALPCPALPCPALPCHAMPCCGSTCSCCCHRHLQCCLASLNANRDFVLLHWDCRDQLVLQCCPAPACCSTLLSAAVVQAVAMLFCLVNIISS